MPPPLGSCAARYPPSIGWLVLVFAKWVPTPSCLPTSLHITSSAYTIGRTPTPFQQFIVDWTKTVFPPASTEDRLFSCGCADAGKVRSRCSVLLLFHQSRLMCEPLGRASYPFCYALLQASCRIQASTRSFFLFYTKLLIFGFSVVNEVAASRHTSIHPSSRDTTPQPRQLWLSAISPAPPSVATYSNLATLNLVLGNVLSRKSTLISPSPPSNTVPAPLGTPLPCTSCTEYSSSGSLRLCLSRRPQPLTAPSLFCSPPHSPRFLIFYFIRFSLTPISASFYSSNASQIGISTCVFLHLVPIASYCRQGTAAAASSTL